jgi:hypothetical protein
MILTIAAIAAAAIGAKVALLTFSKVNDWMSRRKVPLGTGQILSEKLAKGEYAVVAGVFSPQGTKIAEKRWRAKELDGTLNEALRKSGGKIVVNF